MHNRLFVLQCYQCYLHLIYLISTITSVRAESGRGEGGGGRGQAARALVLSRVLENKFLFSNIYLLSTNHDMGLLFIS